MGVADGVGGWQESGINPAGSCLHPLVQCVYTGVQ